MIFKTLLLLVVALYVADAFECPEDFCNHVTCDDLSDCLESNGMKIREKGSFCKCCDICIHLLGENELCFPEGEFSFLVMSECAPGLVCDEALNRCIKPAVQPEA